MARNKDRYSHKRVVNGNKVSVSTIRSVAQVEKDISRITKRKEGILWDFSFLGKDIQAVAEAKGITY